MGPLALCDEVLYTPSGHCLARGSWTAFAEVDLDGM